MKTTKLVFIFSILFALFSFNPAYSAEKLVISSGDELNSADYEECSKGEDGCVAYWQLCEDDDTECKEMVDDCEGDAYCVLDVTNILAAEYAGKDDTALYEECTAEDAECEPYWGICDESNKSCIKAFDECSEEDDVCYLEVANAQMQINEQKILDAEIAASKSVKKSPVAKKSNLDDDNVTTLTGRTAKAEKYTLEVVAPKVDNDVFPVPVKYYKDLLSGNKLKAHLMVPIKLTIKNSRERRLLTIYSSAVKSKVKYGTSLNAIAQVSLSNSLKNSANLITFVGPNKNIFRTSASGKTQVVYFNLPIDRRHFHGSNIKVSVGSSNGVQLTEVCEVANSECMVSAKFKVVPRQVKYKLEASDRAYFLNDKPVQKFTITAADVDVQVNENNIQKTIVSRKKLPSSLNVSYNTQNFVPHLIKKRKELSYVNNMDLYPVINYMSNNSYREGDMIISTHAIVRPDIKMRAAKKVVKTPPPSMTKKVDTQQQLIEKQRKLIKKLEKIIKKQKAAK
ncbi:MAG: hypothetical protein DRQ51_02540 [Gammaproteobacteria bacterium]|nr:MAG: hypothetical protein DRQ51_02540 [Gammaproteobacteria bacterium]